MKDAERQVMAAQKNILEDYRELGRLRSGNKSLADSCQRQESAYNLFLDQLSIPIYESVGAGYCGCPHRRKSLSHFRGGGGSTSDLKWDGRNPDI